MRIKFGWYGSGPKYFTQYNSSQRRGVARKRSFKNSKKYHAQDDHKRGSPSSPSTLRCKRQAQNLIRGYRALRSEYVRWAAGEYGLRGDLGAVLHPHAATSLAREEGGISSYIHVSSDLSSYSDGPAHPCVNISKIIANYPLLARLSSRGHSTCKSTNVTGRVVLKDNWLGYWYFLEQDFILLISFAELL